MADPERGSDHAARIASLRGFEAAISRNIGAGLAELGPIDSPGRIHSALLLLVQNDRFQDAVDVIKDIDKHCKWLDLAVYAHIALRDVESARELLQYSSQTCEDAWANNRCRIAVADATFSEVFDDATRPRHADRSAISDADRKLLEFVIEALSPLVEHVRLSGRIDGAVERIAVEFAASAYDMLGQFSQISELVRPLTRCRPVPLLIAHLTLRKICDPPRGLPGRLRTEHPTSFSAKFVAALLDREFYGRHLEALNSLVELQKHATEEGQDQVEQLSQALFETGSAIDAEALNRARSAVESLLGLKNEYSLYFSAVSMLLEGRPEAALVELDSDFRKDDAIWWQAAAKAQERIGNLDKAAECWDKACQLMPHPDLLNQFAGLSIQQRRFDNAVRALKSAVAQSPDDARLLEQLAFAHTRLRQSAEAVGVFERLTALEPSVARHWINLAYSQAHSGDPGAALKSIDAVYDLSQPELQVVGLRTEILKSLGRAPEALIDLEQLREKLWDDPRFLVLYMDSAYRAGDDTRGQLALQQLLALQHKGQLPVPIFQAVSIDDLKQFGSERTRQREALFTDVVRGRIPWLIAETAIGTVADEAWHRRTQRLRWLSDDSPSRGEWNVYATNAFSVLKTPDGRATLTRIGLPQESPVVADFTSVLTLHRMGLLSQAADYFGKLILPASYGDLPIQDSQRLIPHQASRERELRALQQLVQRGLIPVIEATEITQDTPLVDEYRDHDQARCFSLADVKALLGRTQRATSQELEELTPACHRPLLEIAELPSDLRIIFALSSLRTLARFGWLERILLNSKWSLSHSDHNQLIAELQAYDFQHTIHAAHKRMWEEINRLRAGGKLEFRDSKSCRHDEDDDESDDDSEPHLFDAMLLAGDLDLPLLADDRICQAAILNKYPKVINAAFGTDRLLIALESKGERSLNDVCNDFLQLIRWRYRFLLLEPAHVKFIAERSRDNLPGPELREIAMYVQDSMRDPGLFAGEEKADLPLPMAFKYFMAWMQHCAEFLRHIWADSLFSREQLVVLTHWCIECLLCATGWKPISRRTCCGMGEDSRWHRCLGKTLVLDRVMPQRVSRIPRIAGVARAARMDKDIRC